MLSTPPWLVSRGASGLILAEDFLAQVGAGVELLGQLHQGLHAGGGQPLAHGRNGFEGAGQLQQLAGVHAAHGHFADQALQVVYLAQVLGEVASSSSSATRAATVSRRR